MGGDLDEDWLDLADAVGLLRDQVAEAQQRAAGQPVRFALGEVTVELEVELERTGGLGGGLRWGVVSADARGERSRRSAHRVTVTMTPRLDDGAEVEISDDGD
jgi:Trypsin-co-occurring domain 2